MDRKSGADRFRHARMIFDGPDFDLASAQPGGYATAPMETIMESLGRGYANTSGLSRNDRSVCSVF